MGKIFSWVVMETSGLRRSQASAGDAKDIPDNGQRRAKALRQNKLDVFEGRRKAERPRSL